VSVETPKVSSRILIPAKAIQTESDTPFVFVRVGENAFRKNILQVGRQVDDSVEILKGLNAGDTIVVDDAFILKSEMSKSTMETDND
jgi:cobalt-zinc-cadmium efflux system membrane fusion protein